MNTSAKVTLHIPKEIIPILDDFKAHGGNLSKLLRESLVQWDYDQKHKAQVFYNDLSNNVFGGLQSSL